jgi:hypothetical protein
MPKFDLNIEITGLCLLVNRPGGTRMSLVMPDCRYDNFTAKHPDSDDAVPHTGYLRFDMANLVGSNAKAAPVSDSPNYEIVHRLNREELSFKIDGDKPSAIKSKALAIPSFDEFAPVLEVIPGVFDKSPPKIVLFRTDLFGGTIRSLVANELWTISSELNNGRAVTHEYGGDVLWSRTLDQDSLTLTLSKLDGRGSTDIVLEPRKASPSDARPAINLKLANLCSDNPLEWTEFGPPGETTEDHDFKWLYQLLRLKPSADARRFPISAVPHPIAVPTGKEGKVQDCFAGLITSAH